MDGSARVEQRTAALRGVLARCVLCVCHAVRRVEYHLCHKGGKEGRSEDRRGEEEEVRCEVRGGTFGVRNCVVTPNDSPIGNDALATAAALTMLMYLAGQAKRRWCECEEGV